MAARRIALALLMLVGAASAAQAQNSCTISSTSVAFPNYSVFNASPTDSTGSVTVTCLLPATVTVELSKGASTTYSPRTMKNGSLDLAYNLFVDSARGTIWGDGNSSTGEFQGAVATNTPRTLTVYGRIDARLDVSAGTYTDTITATIIY